MTMVNAFVKAGHSQEEDCKSILSQLQYIQKRNQEFTDAHDLCPDLGLPTYLFQQFLCILPFDL
jgi:hypothetical protein